MANIMLGYSNQIEYSTLSGGSWNASFPITNIKNKLLSKPAITTGNSVTFTFTATSIRAIGIIKTNLPIGATYSLLNGDEYDSGTLTTIVDNQDLIFGLSATASGTFTVTITSNAPISIGRMFIGATIEPSVNHTVGAGLGYVSQSTVETSVGGVEYFKSMPIRRNFSFTLDWLTDAEAYQTLEIIRVSDIINEVLIIPDYTDTIYGYKRNFMGRLASLSSLKNPYVNTHQAGFEILEIV